MRVLRNTAKMRRHWNSFSLSHRNEPGHHHLVRHTEPGKKQIPPVWYEAPRENMKNELGNSKIKDEDFSEVQEYFKNKSVETTIMAYRV